MHALHFCLIGFLTLNLVLSTDRQQIRKYLQTKLIKETQNLRNRFNPHQAYPNQLMNIFESKFLTWLIDNWLYLGKALRLWIFSNHRWVVVPQQHRRDSGLPRPGSDDGHSHLQPQPRPLELRSLSLRLSIRFLSFRFPSKHHRDDGEFEVKARILKLSLFSSLKSFLNVLYV